MPKNKDMPFEERPTRETFEAFKQRIIDAVNDLQYEDDAHIVVQLSKGHGEITRFGCGCPGFFLECIHNLGERLGVQVEHKIVHETKNPLFGKGGEA